MSDKSWRNNNGFNQPNHYSSAQVKSYSNYYSNVNGRESGATQKYVASRGVDGKRRGKLYREKHKGLAKRSYTRDLTNDEIDSTIGYSDGRQEANPTGYYPSVNRNSNRIQDQPGYLSTYSPHPGNPLATYHSAWDGLESLKNVISNQLFPDTFLNDPFYQEF